ncbi:hypothetical protein MBLNU230_g5975t1 [Neophaeotheca triangularis]
MSDVLNLDSVFNKQHEITSILSQRQASLRALYAVTSLVDNNADLSALCDPGTSPPAASDEAAWLKANSISSGFNDDTLPYPKIPHDAPIYDANRNRSSEPSTGQAQTDATAHALASDAPVTASNTPGTAEDAMSAPILQQPSDVLSGSERHDILTSRATPKSPTPKEVSTAMPAQIAQPEPEEEAQLSSATKQLLDLETPKSSAKTVHLPPQKVQEERLREREREQEHEKNKQPEPEPAKGTRFAPASSQTHNELASSPSSTVGAWSATTPMPAQGSPDTSPDSEPGHLDVEPPKDLRPSPREQLEKESHDKHLAAQKEIARQQAMGDVTTPDDQLRWEEREAAARDAEETAAKEDAKGPEPDRDTVMGDTEAEQVTVALEAEPSVGDSQPPAPSKEPLQPKPSSEHSLNQDQGYHSQAAAEDDDNITVTPRTRAPLEADVRSKQETNANETSDMAPPAQTPSAPFSGQLRKESSSGLLAPSPHISPAQARRSSSDASQTEPAPFMTARHPQDRPSSSHAMQTPRKTRRTSLPWSPPKVTPDFKTLSALEGAENDPDRDYLEPLFRTQAHDSGSIPTKRLTDLVRSASKTLGTEDHFTQLHERTDYNILKRIYHLQNANKWSLRQMQHCKEPEQPASHLDHMMAEMKWMRKDFKAERKMKKSICAWLARRCQDYVTATPEEQQEMRVCVKQSRSQKAAASQQSQEQDSLPDLDSSAESAPEDEHLPTTPAQVDSFPQGLIVEPDLVGTVADLKRAGVLTKTINDLPIAERFRTVHNEPVPPAQALSLVSKFVDGKVVPKAPGPHKKRSRYDYQDEDELEDMEPQNKRIRRERDLPPEEQDISLFLPENKHIRDRLHANNAFRPPSADFPMPTTAFYESRSGSQWLFEDDQKLRNLVKDYSFNWTLIASELSMPSRYQSSAERRTPWECFERYVEMETLPTEMRKTVYFKTWYQRLEQSAQAAERKYQAQVAAAQQAQNGGQGYTPVRKRTVPTRVEKRRSSRYIRLVDGFRRAARKKETQAAKQAEQARNASQRKSQAEPPAPRQSTMMTPQQFSQKRHERDMAAIEHERQLRVQFMKRQQEQAQRQRAAAQGGVPGQQQQQPPQQQRPGNPPGQVPHPQQQPHGGQAAQAPRQNVQMAQRNGHLAVPHIGANGVPQAQMRPNGQMAHPTDMQRLAHANMQRNAQQYPNQQQYPMPTPNMQSPGSGGMNNQQQLQSNQALLSAMQASQRGQDGSNNMARGVAQGNNQDVAASPSQMPPPPTPNQMPPQQLSSGMVPAVVAIRSTLKQQHPNITDEQLQQLVSQQLKMQSQSQSSNQHARQQHQSEQARMSAMNAAAGYPPSSGAGQGSVQQNHAQAPKMQQQYPPNQVPYQNNQRMPSQQASPYMNGDSANQNGMNGAHSSPQQQTQHNTYARMMQQQQLQQRQMNQQMQNLQSPNSANTQLAGSPGSHPSPNMTATAESPQMQYAGMNGVAGGMNGQQQAQRPPSRGSNTPQLQRMGSSGSVPPAASIGPQGMQSPNAQQQLQGSPRNMQAGVAR